MLPNHGFNGCAHDVQLVVHGGAFVKMLTNEYERWQPDGWN